MAKDSALAEDPMHVGSSQNIGRLTAICNSNSGGIIASDLCGHYTCIHVPQHRHIHIHVIKKQ